MDERSHSPPRGFQLGNNPSPSSELIGNKSVDEELGKRQITEADSEGMREQFMISLRDKTLNKAAILELGTNKLTRWKDFLPAEVFGKQPPGNKPQTEAGTSPSGQKTRHGVLKARANLFGGPREQFRMVPPENNVQNEAENRSLLPISSISVIWTDWSGQGKDVEFDPTARLPLEQGKFLGRGASADVHEVTCQGVVLARKQIYCSRKMKLADLRNEIDILRRVNHMHIISLVGSYTQGRILGLLLWPVAICELYTFMEDYEEARSGQWTSELWPQFGICVDTMEPDVLISDLRQRLASSFGCLASGIDHLHRNDIRHKDIKPQNILLTKDNLYITDFGLSKDLSEASTSITDGIERGTHRYFAPEVARWEPRGRAADIFSLGCVFLEMHTVSIGYSLNDFGEFRKTNGDVSFHGNLRHVFAWIDKLRAGIASREASTWSSEFLDLITAMLAPNSTSRPSSLHVCRELSAFHVPNCPSHCLYPYVDGLTTEVVREHSRSRSQTKPLDQLASDIKAGDNYHSEPEFRYPCAGKTMAPIPFGTDRAVFSLGYPNEKTVRDQHRSEL
ncbi:MAG: hypothetical protein M1812_003954 [Candelaria pacifica]|nr:MAG: hypothetical protein M1812_003954 [Candelaria pacifica]